MTYRHNTYACKIVGATIQLEVLVAKLLPAHREEALAIARNAARFLMDRSRPGRRPAGLLPADLLLRPDLLVAGRKPGQDDDHGGLRRRKRLSRPLRRDGRPDLLRPGAGHRGDLLQAATRRRPVPDQGRFRDRGAGQRLQGDAHAGHGVFRTAKTSTASPATAAASPGRRSGCAATHSKVST